MRIVRGVLDFIQTLDSNTDLGKTTHTKATSFWTLAAVSDWWKIKSHLLVKFINDASQAIEVRNTSNRETGEFEIVLYIADNELKKCGDGIDEFKARKSDKGYVVRIDNLAANGNLKKTVCLN